MARDATPVVVTADDYYAALAGVRGLAAGGYAPWVTTHMPRSLAARSRDAAGVTEVPDPAADAEAFVRAVASASEQIGAKAVLPATEQSLLVLAGRDSDFPSGVVLGAPPPEIVERATDKRVLAELAAAAGLKTPPTVEVTRESATDVELSFPAIVKPLRTALRGLSGGIERRFYAEPVASRDDLRTVLAGAPGERWLVQPLLEGTLEAACGVVWGGQLVCYQQQEAKRVWPPSAGTSSYAVTVAVNEELREQVATLLQELGWSGLYQIQFLATASQRHLIDINPRMWGSLGLALAAGQNPPAIWADLLLGREPQLGSYRTGVRFRAEAKDARALVHELVRGDRGAAVRGLLPHRRTTHAVTLLRDPAPLLALLPQLRRRRGLRTRG